MHNHQCGCGTTAEMLMEQERRRFPGSYGQFAAANHPSPAPQAARTEGFAPTGAVLTGTVQTLSRQRMPDLPSVPMRTEDQPQAMVPASRGSSVFSARRGLALMIGTVFGRAVQYVQPASPNVAPVQNYGLLRINDLLDPEHRALEMPRYHFAAVDSQAMLDRAKIAAQMMLNTGQIGGGP